MIVTNNIDKFICEEGPRSIRIGKYNRPLFYMIDKIGLYPECNKLIIKYSNT